VIETLHKIVPTYRPLSPDKSAAGDGVVGRQDIKVAVNNQ